MKQGTNLTYKILGCEILGHSEKILNVDSFGVNI